MFRRKTVLVVGAGASYELDLPTGDDLKGDLATLLNITFPDGYSQKTGDEGIKECLIKRVQNRGQRDWNDLLRKCWLIKDALPVSLSIDNLLDAHAQDNDLVFCGKLAITRAILNAERKSKLFAKETARPSSIFQRVSGTWLIPFFQILTENVKKDEINRLFDNLTIISFNYDRCIEAFLPAAIEAYYGISASEASACASSLQIIHPYGQVGQLSAQGDESHTPFGGNRYNLEAIAGQIRTFSEGLADPKLSASIETSCRSALQIIFLGFAFHPINMDILSTSDVSCVRKVFGTTLGLSNAAQRVVGENILQSFKKFPVDRQNASSLLEHKRLDELNLEPLKASNFLYSHFRGIA